MCEQKTLWGKRCVHFDFGAALRELAETGERSSALTNDDIGIILHSLQTGMLLEDKDFHIAGKILFSFADEKRLQKDEILLLNGLPRHIGQAKAVDAMVDVRLVVNLECLSEVIFKRIRFDAGGDRSGRVDDSFEEIEKKLKIFYERTLPLLDHYRRNEVKIAHIHVNIHTQPEHVYRRLNADHYHDRFMLKGDRYGV